MGKNIRTTDFPSSRQGLLDLGDRTADEHQIATRLDRARTKQIDFRSLDHRVGGLQADGDAGEIEKSESRFDHRGQTIRKESLSTQRRIRLKLKGLVRPSPVGLAMVNEQNPSPP